MVMGLSTTAQHGGRCYIDQREHLTDRSHPNSAHTHGRVQAKGEDKLENVLRETEKQEKKKRKRKREEHAR